MSNCVMDSSALLAYLADESGASDVETYLSANVCMSTANWAEVMSKASDWGMDLEKLEHLFKEGGLLGGGTLKLFPLTVQDAISIGKLRSKTKSQGLSLGDRACLALALRLKLLVLTADRSWSKLKLGVEVKVIR